MAERMPAVVFQGEGRWAVEERPVPRLRNPDDVLLQVEACGICGTDLHILEVPPGHPATPGVILGHEVIGRVVEVGPAVTHLRPGDRVAIAPNLYCGVCAFCQRGLYNHCERFTTLGIFLDGGLAPYEIAPARALFPISPEMPLERAIFTEVLSTVVGGTLQARLHPGEHAVVLGCGPVGLLFLQIFRASGAGTLVAADIAPFRLSFAQRAGADLVVNPREEDLEAVVRKATGIGADVVVDAVGSLLATALRLARPGGTVVLFGMNAQARAEIAQYEITRRELRVVGSYVGRHTFPLAIQMLERGVIQPEVFVTHRLPLDRFGEGLEHLRRGEAVKVMMVLKDVLE
ncbi:alcohol dehydrogenase catalytic domain-containing protein [Thermoflexus sp.]|uniref:alcohol dehydrogenase catalytic domain-containing protein n=1 Tax=Thermoflexus sp. TaxID=1969742 RepID=UPI0035E462F8